MGVRVRQYESVGVARHRLALHLQYVVTAAGYSLDAPEHLVTQHPGQPVLRVIQTTDSGDEFHHVAGDLAPFGIVTAEEARSSSMCQNHPSYDPRYSRSFAG